ncbi:L,D-transpeptidase, partial [bacterium]|nr:L,D-transpeptidase [bacterium]
MCPKIFLILGCFFSFVSCALINTPSRIPSSSSNIMRAKLVLQETANEEGPSQLQVEESMGITDLNSRSSQFLDYFESLCEKDASTCIENIGGSKEVRATLLLRNSKFYLDVVKTIGSKSTKYSCLASPGRNSFLNIDPEYDRTPKVTNKNPEGLELNHVVSQNKSYAGATMPYTVWVIGSVAIHGSVLNVTGRRRSHGCINLDMNCARRFYEDVVSVGKSKTFITILDN